MRKENWGRLAFTSVMGLFLSSTFVFLAALPIRYTRLYFGRGVFVLTGLLGSSALLLMKQWQWAVVYLGLNVLIGSYREMEEKKFSIFLASLVSIGTTTFLFFASLLGAAKWQGLQLSQMLNQHLEPMMTQLKQLPRFQKGLDIHSVIFYLPAGLVVTFMLVTFISLTFSTDLSQRNKNLKAMKAFALPDWMIWLFIASLAGTFSNLGNEVVSLVSVNVFAITVAAYFFQGFAVFACWLDRFKIYGFWRLLAYFIVFFQMFIFVSGLGILDYWFDFRTQLKIKSKTV